MKKPVYGFKVKISQLSIEHKYSHYDKILLKLYEKGWKFIHLKRENFIRLKPSNILTVETNIFHLKGEVEAYKNKVKVNFNLLMKAITFGEETEKTEEENLKKVTYLKFIYQRDILDNTSHQVTAN